MKLWLPFLQQGRPKQYPCGLSATEGQLYDLIVNDPRQQRERLVCHPLLVKAAQAKVQQCRLMNDVLHTIGGIGANQNVILHGYHLPSWYTAGEGNNVESLAVGQRSPGQVLEAWYNSPDHRDHVFGRGPFFAGQTRIGVGFTSQPSPRGWAFWWAVITAHEGD